MGIDNEGHPCGFCFVMYSFFHQDFKLMNKLEMLFNSSQELNLMGDLSELTGILAIKKGGKKGEGLEDNKEEMILETKRTVRDPEENLLKGKDMKGQIDKIIEDMITGTENIEERRGTTEVRKGIEAEIPERMKMRDIDLS